VQGKVKGFFSFIVLDPLFPSSRTSHFLLSTILNVGPVYNGNRSFSYGRITCMHAKMTG
jgi:hypothetical protein